MKCRASRALAPAPARTLTRNMDTVAPQQVRYPMAPWGSAHDGPGLAIAAVVCLDVPVPRPRKE